MLFLNMLRKILTVLLIVSMALAFYSTTLIKVSSGEGASISVLDVCSKKVQAGFMAAPTVPEPVFTFNNHRPFENLSSNEEILFSHVYISVLEKPPTT